MTQHPRVAIPIFTLVGLLAATGAGQEPATGEPAVAPAERFTRRVALPPGAAPAVVVCDFYTHGALAPGGAGLSVVDGERNAVPFRLLQQGPGDLARVAFAPVPRQSRYVIGYGGAAGEGSRSVAGWSPPAGLLVETRRYVACNLGDPDAVASAFTGAEPIGADLVPNVFHRANPVVPEPSPFFSRYSGTLRLERPGRYTFFTSSQDCSFLYIDDRLVVGAPGAHGPAGHARFRGEVELAAGPHRFVYLHAASGPDSCMVAAWADPRTGKIGPIPPEAFGAGGVARPAAVGPYRDGERRMQDFAVAILGEVPLPVADDEDDDAAPPLLRVQFRSPTAGARGRWDFGDGQAAAGSDVAHIYLHPGVYTVTLAVPGDPPGLRASNRVWVHRPLVPDDPKAPPDTLAAYLPTLGRYDAATLDAPGIRQLLRAMALSEQPARAAAAGLAWLSADPPPEDGPTAVAVAGEVAPLLRDPLGQPARALAAWEAAARVATAGAEKARCAIEAAELLLHDLDRPADARPLLESATRDLGSGTSGAAPALSRRLHALVGDLHAREGDGDGARASYARAAAVVDPDVSAVRREARRGAHGRSVEAYLRADLADRAVAELRLWQREAPEDRLTGDLALLEARIWAAKGRDARVLRVADDLLALRPEHNDADRLLDLSARCALRLGRPDEARARWGRLLKDYPGSPLVGEVKAELAKGQARAAPQPAPAASPGAP
jgi:tetratricopeptide (TPR) repeat protein